MNILDEPVRPVSVPSRPEVTTEWTTTITPHRGWLDWRLQQLWRYRDLISLFVWRDFVSAYKQTILGPAWHVIQPLLTTLMFTIVFSKVARLSTDGVPPFLFYLCGTVAWTYFANNLTKTSATFVGNAHLLGKVYFHRLVLPISVTISNLITFAIQLGIFLVALVGYRLSGVSFISMAGSCSPPVPFHVGRVWVGWWHYCFSAHDPLSRLGQPRQLRSSIVTMRPLSSIQPPRCRSVTNGSSN